jgi:hypothetical protein
MVSSGISRSSQDACGCPLGAGEPRVAERVAEREATRATQGVAQARKTAGLSEVECVLRERTLRLNSYTVLNGLSAYSSWKHLGSGHPAK